MSEKKTVKVSVLVDDDHKSKMGQVAGALKKKGFVISSSLDAIGVITGSVSAAEVASLASVAGVASVEEERSDYRTQ